jgi:hypothetical protein
MRIAHHNLAAGLTAFAIAGLLCGSASAQQTAQQTDREKAWAVCLAEVNKAQPTTGSGDNEAQRVAAFKACMARHGIRP